MNNVELQVKKEALDHFAEVYSIYEDVKSRLRSPRTKKALGDIKVKSKEGDKIKASQASSAVPSSAEVFINNIKKKIKRRKEEGFKGEFQKNIEPKLEQLSEESGRDVEELKNIFFETAVQWLNGLDELGEKTRTKLLDQYPPRELVGISKTELQKIKGIGERRAEKILQLLSI